MKKLRVTVDGKAYEVTVEILSEGSASAHPFSTAGVSAHPVSAASVSAPVSAPVPSAKPGGGGKGIIPSPLAGKVVVVDVQAGDAVEEGATLITLEAMKMNTFVTAPHSGTVGMIYVKTGDSVEEGQDLLTLS